MQHNYAQAVLALITNNTPLDAVLAGLRQTLEAHHHEALYGRVLLEVARTLEAGPGTHTPVVAVAREADIAALEARIARALTTLGAPADASVSYEINPTLTGGFVAQYNHRELDHSYKHALASLYAAITH